MDKNFASIDKVGIAVIKRFPVNFHQAKEDASRNGKTSNGTYDRYSSRGTELKSSQHDFHRVPCLSPPPCFIHIWKRIILTTRVEQIYSFICVCNHFLSIRFTII